MIRPFGEAALLVELDDAAQAQALDRSLRANPITGVAASVPGLVSLLVEVDPLSGDLPSVATVIRARIGMLADSAEPGRLRNIPVAYGGEYGPDLAAAAELCGLAPEELVARHASAELRVLFDGFAPGFAYLGDLPAEIHVPRLEAPRTRTPRGAVAIAGPMTGIYPADLPGGWRVIGRTSVTLFDPSLDPPAYLVPGDRVRFQPVDPDELAHIAGTPTDWR